ncbi:MAG: hypothetical protein RJB13_1655 [Pseudomonadota bacterium]
MEQSHKKTVEQGRFLSFQLSGETYALPIHTVAEIIGLGDITHVPNIAPYMRGIINFKGKVLPVMDLRKRLLLKESPLGRENCIVIVDVWSKRIGMIVDSVRDVIEFKKGQIETAPEIGGQPRSQILTGIGKLPDRVVLLVDPCLILTAEEVAGHARLATVA